MKFGHALGNVACNCGTLLNQGEKKMIDLNKEKTHFLSFR